MQPMEDFYLKYRKATIWFANKFLDDIEQARDVAGGVFLSLLAEGYEIKGDNRDLARLMTRTRTQCINILRRRVVENKWKGRQDKCEVELPEIENKKIDFHHLVQEALPHLTKREKDIVTRLLHGDKTKKIAKDLQINVVTVRRMWQMAVERLRSIVLPQIQ